jgi:hypothetical protein
MGSDISCRWPRRAHIKNCWKLNRKQTRKSVTVLVFFLHSSNAAQMWHSFNLWTYNVQGFCYRKRFECNGWITIHERARHIFGGDGVTKGRTSSSADCDERGYQYWATSCYIATPLWILTVLLRWSPIFVKQSSTSNLSNQWVCVSAAGYIKLLTKNISYKPSTTNHSALFSLSMVSPKQASKLKSAPQIGRERLSYHGTKYSTTLKSQKRRTRTTL